MSTQYDLIVRGGTVVDGTGAEPFAADVAVRDGRVAAVGSGLGAAVEEIDAGGMLVTPGFVDIHTHYDAQACWDSHLAPSALHGVTTVVMGNCGVGFAPCRPADRDQLVELMEGVEDIPGAVMHEGLEWRWESFPGYLDALERKARDVDVCALLPHAAVRVYVMGARALTLEPATADDIARMREITAAAVRAGAFGVSTSRTTSHRSLNGEFIPTLRAYEDELQGLALGVRDGGRGLLEVVTEWIQPNPAEEFAMLCRIAERSRQPVLYSLTQYHDQPEDYRAILGLNRQAAAARGCRSARWWRRARSGCCSACRPARRRSPVAPRSGRWPACRCPPGWPDCATPRCAPPSWRRTRSGTAPSRCCGYSPTTACTGSARRPTTPPWRTTRWRQSPRARAGRRRRSPTTCCWRTRAATFSTPRSGTTRRPGLAACEELLADRLSIMGLGDGGAHVGFILDAGYPTWLLTYWGRQRGRWPPAELIRRLTSDPAAAAGLHDRGRIRVGLKGDLNVDRLAAARFRATPCRARPAGRRRPPDAGRARLPLHGGGRPGDLSRRPPHRRAARQAGARHARVDPITGSISRQANRGVTPCPDGVNDSRSAESAEY